MGFAPDVPDALKFINNIKYIFFAKMTQWSDARADIKARIIYIWMGAHKKGERGRGVHTLGFGNKDAACAAVILRTIFIANCNSFDMIFSFTIKLWSIGA